MVTDTKKFARLKKESKNVNFDIDIGKSGFEWRRLQLINPIIYVALVQLLTTEENWGELMNKFEQFAENKKIQCKSIPVVTQKPKKAARERILRWWMEVEQTSIEQVLDYSYVFETDIARCYDSIYTHSIPWAIYGKGYAKNNKKKETWKMQLTGTSKQCLVVKLTVFLRDLCLWILLQKLCLGMSIQN